MTPSSQSIHAALEAESRDDLRTAAAASWRQQFADHAWRCSVDAIASDDRHHAETVDAALEAATEALEGMLAWGGRRADPDGRLLSLVALIDLVRPGLAAGEGAAAAS